jgi:hypothetical protein
MGQQNRGDHAVEHLGLHQQLDQTAGDQRDRGADHDPPREQAHEQFGLAEPFANRAFRADCSLTAYAVDSGTTAAASAEAPNKPSANSSEAYRPANGRSAYAARVAESSGARVIAAAM